MAVLLTPLIGIIQKRIAKYVGQDVAKKMKLEAMGLENEV
jgi:hypothetical protein